MNISNNEMCIRDRYMGVKGITVSKGEKGCILRILLPKEHSWEICEGRILPLLKEFVGVNIVKTEERLVDDNTWSVTCLLYTSFQDQRQH